MNYRDTDTYKLLDLLTACLVVEGCARPDYIPEDDADGEYTCWQYIHDQGGEYFLQGFYGRSIANLLEAGVIEP